MVILDLGTDPVRQMRIDDSVPGDPGAHLSSVPCWTRGVGAGYALVVSKRRLVRPLH